MTSDARAAALSRANPEQGVAPEDAARSDYYALLARLFTAAPDRALLEALAQAGEIDADAGFDALATAWQRLRHAASGADPAALRQEFDDLFVGVGPSLVSPYATRYRDVSGVTMPLAQLRTDLAELGLARQDGVKEPEDHFAALADVMRLLITDADRPPEDRLARQQGFFLKYIEPSYRGLADAIAAAPEADFYRRVGDFLRAFLDLETESFQINRI